MAALDSESVSITFLPVARELLCGAVCSDLSNLCLSSARSRQNSPFTQLLLPSSRKHLMLSSMGPWKKLLLGRQLLEDIDEDTFIRFCQFAYTGDYTTPEFVHVPAVETPEIVQPAMLNDEEPVPDEPVRDEPVPEPAETGWGTIGQKPKKAKKLSKSSRLRQSLHDQFNDTATTRMSSAARCEVRQNSDPLED